MTSIVTGSEVAETIPGGVEISQSRGNRHLYCAVVAALTSIGIFIVNPLWNEEAPPRQIFLFLLCFAVVFGLWEFAMWASRGWLMNGRRDSDG